MHQSRPRPPLDTANHYSADIHLTAERQQVIKYDKEAEMWRSGWQSGSGRGSFKVVNNEGESLTVYKDGQSFRF